MFQSNSSAPTSFPRGAEWRQWDLHVHSPASFHWTGPRLSSEGNSAADKKLIDEMIGALNSAEPSVFALMDYWTFDGWFALKARLREADSPKLKKLIFPGIELRLVSPTQYRLNAHVLFSDLIDDQTLRDFKAALQVASVNLPLSDDCLRKLARNTAAALLPQNFRPDDVRSDDAVALRAGSTIAEITCESYRNAIARVPDEQAIGFMPYSTSDGLSGVDYCQHLAYFLSLFTTSPIFESRNLDTRGAFVNEKTPGNAKWIANWQEVLGHVPRLVVAGSDAHCFATTADGGVRGYGDFPNGKVTWVKADPSFRGLKQAIKEPAKRSYIGHRPQKLLEIEQNKTFYIRSIQISKVADATIPERWLDGTKLDLSSDLVAIIGNKGSGKSALADIIALLGNTRQKEHLSFLQRNRFRGRSGEPAKHFVAKLKWHDDSECECNLNDDPPSDRVEMVRYIPQGHFEALCNAHVSGRSAAFEEELRNVIFSHADESIRLGALDFGQLIEQQEGSFRDRLSEFRKDLQKLNREIASCEDQSQPEVISALRELQALRAKQLEEHDKLRPIPLPKPADELTDDQKKAAAQIEQLDQALANLKIKDQTERAGETALAARSRAIQNIRERMRLLERTLRQFSGDVKSDLAILGMEERDIISYDIKAGKLDAVETNLKLEKEALGSALEANSTNREKLQKDRTLLSAELNQPQLIYQQNLGEIAAWEMKRSEIEGTVDSPESLKGIGARIEQLEALPDRLTEYSRLRAELAGEIFDTLDEQRKAREALFRPVHDLIQGNSLIREDYKLRFLATLGCSSDTIGASLFALVKQSSGEFRGEDESYGTLKRLAEQYDFNTRSGAIGFVTELHQKLQSGSKNQVGLQPILRKDRKSNEVYDLLYGLEFLQPRYSLLFQDAQIEQLSPGQRGALLLIFYLLVDKGRNPIILDQPEENLDNETVVNLLVPVVTEAKKFRQIIMVTHNPNLAVVCDAEQVIHATFDRKDESRISYVSGSIEDPVINSHVVNVLEGTKPAFQNRYGKYH